VPFAFALGALIMRYPGEKWIRITRPLDHGDMGLPDLWRFPRRALAYSVFGLGGYWGWDPVENASLMPWLTGTAFPAFRNDAGKTGHAKRCGICG